MQATWSSVNSKTDSKRFAGSLDFCLADLFSARVIANSFDDNEATSWSNDGQLDSAWINYELDRPASINEVTLKPGSWRTRSYPIRISVDDQTVFNGSTSPSLGCVTFTFPPTMGRHVKIELTGAPKDANNVGNAVGITGNPEVSPRSSAFSIVEVEIYEPTKQRPR